MEVKTQGDNPTGDVLFASCDSNYFLNHGPAFMMSAIKFKQNLHLHIVNPDKHVNNIVERVSKFNNLIKGIISVLSVLVFLLTLSIVDFYIVLYRYKTIVYKCI